MNNRRLMGMVLAACASAAPAWAVEAPGGAARPASEAKWGLLGGTLSLDPQGWAFHPALAAGDDGSLYAAWTQHFSPPKGAKAGIFAKRWANGAWEPLGERLLAKDGKKYSGYHASIAVLDKTPYVAWYEGDGYGRGPGGTKVFVAHWNGTAWACDADPNDPSGTVTTPKTYGRDPVIAAIGGKVYVASVEVGKSNDFVVVKHLDGGQWIQDGEGLSSKTKEGPCTKILNIALADVDGIPHVAWSELKETGRRKSFGSTVQVFALAGSQWSPIGNALNGAPESFASYVTLATHGKTLYAAYLERTRAGNNQVFVKHWNGNAWAPDGAALNADAKAESGRPGMASAGGKVWLAWTESPQGQRAQLYTRVLAGEKWSAADGTWNVDPKDGAADCAVLASGKDRPHLIWAEKDFHSSTKQIFVRSFGATSAADPTPVARYGVNGPAVTLTPNQWVDMNAAGIIDAKSQHTVGDEGFGSLVYSATIRKALVFGQYHAGEVSSGENQNALLGYSFKENRWDLVEVTECAWSENLPGVGHPYAKNACDDKNGLFITRGNFTLNNGTMFRTYVYDLRAGRGKRMMPDEFWSLTSSAFDNDRCQWFTLAPREACLYDPRTNAYTKLSEYPCKGAVQCVYDTKRKGYLLVGPDSKSAATLDVWTFDPDKNAWEKKAAAANPPPARIEFNIAYDSANDVVLLCGGKDSPDTWVYEPAANAWTKLVAAAPKGTNPSGGNNLCYNSDEGVFLLKHSCDLTHVWALKYVRQK